jgi:hypothetical protein
MRKVQKWSLLLLVASVLAFTGAAWALSTLTLDYPGEGAESVSTSFNFQWTLTPDSDVTSPDLVSYDLYLSKTLSGLASSSPLHSGLSFAGYTGTASSDTLDEDSLYFWKVVAHTPSGDVGATSFFMTQGEDASLVLKSPSDGQPSVPPQNVEFKWEFDSGDDTLDASDVTFDLYISDKYETIFDGAPKRWEIQALDPDVVDGVFNVTINHSVGYGKHYWTVVAHVDGGGDFTASPHSFTTLTEASDPNLSGGCSAAPLGSLAAVALLAGLVLAKRGR